MNGDRAMRVLSGLIGLLVALAAFGLVVLMVIIGDVVAGESGRIWALLGLAFSGTGLTLLFVMHELVRRAAGEAGTPTRRMLVTMLRGREPREFGPGWTTVNGRRGPKLRIG